MRNLRNKFDREVGNAAIFEETPYVIKIGFNKAGENDKQKKAGKLPGFLICHNSKRVGATGYAPAFDEMAALGYSRQQIEQAMEEELTAAPGQLLPLGLRVAIPRDAKRIGEGQTARWIYPGTFVQEFQLWGKSGLACEGDGETATKHKQDFTTQTIKCVPLGTALDKDCCPFSVDKSCKSKSRWIFTPFYVDERGIEQPISRTMGWNATAKLDTTSEYAQLAILEELDRAADQLDGRIRGLTGTLFFGVHEKRYDGGKSVGKVGQVRLRIDEPQLARRASGESERIASAVSVAVPEQISKPAPQPEREAPPTSQSAPAPTNSQEPADEEREPAPSAVDISAMSDERMLQLLTDYVGSSSGPASEIVWFTMAGVQKHPPLDWFLSDDAHAVRIGRERLREICNREFARPEFLAWCESSVGAGVAS